MPTKTQKKTSTKSRILRYLETGRTLTIFEASILFRCLSLSQHIAELRKEGHNIVSPIKRTRSGKYVSFYQLINPTKP